MSNADSEFIQQIEIAVGRLALRYGVTAAIAIISITAAAVGWAVHLDNKIDNKTEALTARLELIIAVQKQIYGPFPLAKNP